MGNPQPAPAYKKPVIAEVPSAVNDNIELKPDSLKHLREAINAPDRNEVGEMILNSILENNILNKIELKTPTETIKLTEEARHYLFPKILATVHEGLAVALVGPAGSGKSTVCEQVAIALKLKYYLQNSVQGAHELTGYLDAHGRYHSTTFRNAFEKGGLLLVDEVDTSDPGALKWMNTALANGHAMFPDVPDPVKRHPDFRILIAANTFGTGADRVYVGANQLDASTLDRFIFLEFLYDQKLEMALAGNLMWVKRVQKIRTAVDKCKARVVVSPRASIHGAKLLKMGWTQSDTENATVWRGMDAELRGRITKEAA